MNEYEDSLLRFNYSSKQNRAVAPDSRIVNGKDLPEFSGLSLEGHWAQATPLDLREYPSQMGSV